MIEQNEIHFYEDELEFTEDNLFDELDFGGDVDYSDELDYEELD